MRLKKFGAIIGRYGNRIAKGKFLLEGETHHLTVNDGSNHLHGGQKGFDKQLWLVEQTQESGEPSITLSYLSKDGEEGYPGNLKVRVTYKLTDENALEISYEAETDRKTIVNLTHHSYFNLSGEGKTILDHELELDAKKMLPVDSELIPTGELRDVEGTPFDFTLAKLVGKDISAEDEQLQKGSGYDHCWVLHEKHPLPTLKPVATLYHPPTGRLMTVSTDQPGIQLYTGNFLDGKHESKFGGKYERRSALCLETQNFPDSPNRPEFPSCVITQLQTYSTTTSYKFSTK